MRKLKIGKIITGILMIFLFSGIFPSCATTNVSMGDASRQSLMMQERIGRSTKSSGTKYKATKASKHAQKRGGKYKKSKHKYKKRSQPKRRRR